MKKEAPVQGRRREQDKTGGPEDYGDTHTALRAHARVGQRLSEGMDGLMGAVEWLKTDLLKKGRRKHMDALDRVSEGMEAVSRKLEAGILQGKEGEKTDPLALYEWDREATEAFERLKKSVEAVTADDAFPGEEDLNRIRSLVKGLESQLQRDVSL
jgi:hypothetical protein